MLLDESLRESVRRNLSSFAVRRADPGTHRAAAVAVPLVEEGHGADLEGMSAPEGWSLEAALLLTRRSARLSRHANQWALPGGRMDPGESPQDTALRELEEEVGLRLDASHVLGRLDDYVTRSGFVITPVVVWAGAAHGLAADPGEVASIHRIRVREFLRTDAPWLEPSDDPGRQIMRMPVGATWIAAPTAAILHQFCEVALFGRATRMDRFDEPMFARR